MFTERKDVAGVPSARTGRARKVFEAQLDAALGESVRADGSCALDLWSALTNVVWHGPTGEVVRYSSREAGEVVAWVREEGDTINWFCGDPSGQVANWISDAMAGSGWKWVPA